MKLVRLLAAAIVAVLVVAVVIVIVQEPRVSSSAEPPKPTPAGSSLPVAMAPPSPQPPSSAKSPTSVTPARNVKLANHLSTSWGIDVSWPQCGPLGMPAVQPGFVVVGINGGKPFTDNTCLAREVTYARTRTGVSAYLNIDAPRSGDAAAYGRKVALDGLARVQRAHLALPVLWLDVEILNHWSSSAAANVAVINGALRALQQR